MQVEREPIDPKEIKQELDDVFTFNQPQTAASLESCRKIQKACHELATLILNEMPEGKERTIAINGVLSAALFANHGITRRQIAIASAPLTPELAKQLEGEPVPSTENPPDNSPGT